MLMHHGKALRHCTGALRYAARNRQQLVARRLEHVDARSHNENPFLGAARFAALAPLGGLAAAIGAVYASDGVREAFDERFPRIMSDARRVLPGLPPMKQKVTEAEPETVTLELKRESSVPSLSDVGPTEEVTPQLTVDDGHGGAEATEPSNGPGDDGEPHSQPTLEFVPDTADVEKGEDTQDTPDDEKADAAHESSAAPADTQITEAEEEADKVEEEETVEAADSSVSESDNAQVLQPEVELAPAPAPAPAEHSLVQPRQEGEGEEAAMDRQLAELTDGLDVEKILPQHKPHVVPEAGESTHVDVRLEVDAINGRAAQRSADAVTDVLNDAVLPIGSDLDNTDDVATLKQRIRLLEAHHHHRSQAEAARLHEILRKQKQELDAEYDHLVDRKVAELEAEHRQQLLRLDQELEEELQEETARLKETFNAKLKQGARNYGAAKRDEMEKELTRRTEQMQLEATQQLDERRAAIQELRMKVATIERISDFHRNYESITRDTHRRSFAAFKLLARLETGEPLGSALDELREGLEVHDDELLAVALDSVPEVARNEGVPTSMDLQRQFIELKDSAVSASMAPASGGLAGRAVAWLFSKLIVRPDAASVAAGTFYNPEAPMAVERLERAHYLLDQGDLNGSADQVNMLLAEHDESAVVEVLSQWLKLARARCLVTQAVQILQARAATVAETQV